MKKIAIIYASFHKGNTKKVAYEIAKEINADIFSVKDARDKDFSEYDILGFASGIYYGKIHKSINKIINETKNLPKNTFVIATSGVLHTKYKENFAEKLSSLGFNCISSFQCKGFDTFGPFKLIGGIAKGHPNEKDLENARLFAKEILEKYSD